MNVCPCCGNSKELTLDSEFRKGVKICKQCFLNSENTNVWSVDSRKPSKELRKFFDKRYNYEMAYNCSDDKVYVEKCRREYETAKNNRKEVKSIVVVHSSDGVSPLSEFSDRNRALAYSLGWLGEYFTQTGAMSWVSMYGAVIEVMNI